jgi:hypothetical protein
VTLIIRIKVVDSSEELGRLPDYTASFQKIVVFIVVALRSGNR